MSQYIPDLTERFPEGFGGVDMTPSYFGEPVDWSRVLKPDNEEEYDEEYEYEALCERADRFGMESLTEHEQFIIKQHTENAVRRSIGEYRISK